MVLAFTAAAILAVAAAPAHAQSSAWGDNGYVSINALYDVAALESTIDSEDDLYRETASYAVTQDVGARPVYDVTAGGRLRGNFGFGFGVSYAGSSKDSVLRGRVPSPFYFNQPRQLEGSTQIDREDLMVHLAALWLLPITESTQISVFGGPSWFQIKQETITGVNIEEQFPFDVVQFTNVELERRTATAWGFNAGFDVSYYFSRYLGVHGLLRYSKGTATVTATGVDSDVNVGGFHAGVGLRIRY